MRFYLLLLVSLTTTQVWGQQFFRELIMKPENSSAYSDYYGQACLDDLKTFYKSGKTLKSPKMASLLKPISALAADETLLETTRKTITKLPSGYFTFYHYTKAPNLLSAFSPEEKNRDLVHEKNKKNAYVDMMSFLKVPTSSASLFSTQYYRLSRGFVYVSACPSCSTSYGDIQLSFTFSPETKVLNTSDFSWYDIQNETSRLYPEVFRSCSFEKIGNFFAEDSGADLISYAGGLWYQLTNFYKVINSDGMMTYGSHDRETTIRAASRTYTLGKSWSMNGIPAKPATVVVGKPTPVPVVKPDPSIKIIEASWGLKNNILKNVKTFCDGKTSCDYKVHEKYLPGMTYDSAKPQPFTVKWNCDGVTLKTKIIPGDAHDKIASISCES